MPGRSGGQRVGPVPPDIRPLHHRGLFLDQFDARVRGTAGWPLLNPRLLSPAVMVNVLGQHVAPVRRLLGEHPEWFCHDYGKAEECTDRKMGHLTVLTDDLEQTAKDLEATGCWPDLD